MPSTQILPDIVENIINWHLKRYPEVGKQQPSIDSYRAIEHLATTVILPVIERFGPIEITYGFTSPKLLRLIQKVNPQGTSPKLDQHAAHEHSKSGNAFCPRFGAAVDFIAVRNSQNMDIVADWISLNIDFDRLYFYDKNRPVHVSTGPENKKAIQLMTTSKTGKRVPGRKITGKPFSSIFNREE